VIFKNALGRSYVAQAPITDQEFTMNWSVEVSEAKGATTDVTLLPTPGVQTFVMVSKVGWRGLFEMNGRCFGVAQDGLYEITYPAQQGTATLLGTVALDTNPVTFCTNGSGGNQLFVTSGGNGYCLDLTTLLLTQITNLNGKATQGGYLQGYFLAFDVNTSTVFYSDLLDGLTWDPLSYFQRTNQPDDWQAMQVTTWGYICLPGQYSGEMWYPTGGFPLPFAPDPAGNFNKGIAATFSITNAGGSVVWLSVNNDGDYEVVQATGLQPARISDFALEYQLSQFVKTDRIDDAVGESFRMDGHTFFRLTLPTARSTKQFDFTNGLWTDVGTWLAQSSEFTYFRPVFYAFAFGKHLIGDRETGALYDMDSEYQTDVDGRDIRRVRRTPAIVSEQDYVFHRKLSILLQTGDAPLTGQGSSPVLMLRYSDDGGRTWGNEVQCEVGETGAYSALVWFQSLGVSRNRVYELSCTDPMPWRLSQIFLDAVPQAKRAA